jgi:hypothetical protein
VNRAIAITALTLGSIAGVLALVMWFDPVNATLRARLAPDWTNAQRALIYGFTAAAVLAALGKSIAFLRHEWLLSRMVYAKQGLLPAVAGGAPLDTSHITPAAQIMSATVGGQGNVDRLPGSGLREAIKPTELALPEPAISVSVTPQQVLDGYDPEREPHWLLLGETGSGKSRAVMSIAQMIARRYPSQFVICERGGIDWNAQADARTVEGYATALEAVEQERQYRIGLLRANDVDHVLRLNEPLPLLVLIIEEAENIYRRLYDTDRERARRFLATLQDLAGLGRKQGIVLLVATPTGTSSVFDGPTRRNLGNKLIFRSEVIVGDQWGIPREVNLSQLPSGTAYAPKYGCTVAFPLTARPRLPKSGLYHEPDDLQLGNAIARLDDDPTTEPTVATGTTADNWPPGGGLPAVAPVATVARIDRSREPTPEEAEAMRQHYARTHSKTAVCMRFYGYKDGATFDYVTAALEGKL